MNDLAAALGLVQLGKLERANAMRRRLVQRYREALAPLTGLEPLAQRAYGQSACYSMVVKLDERDALCDYLLRHSIESGVHFYPNHLLPVYRPYIAPLPVTEEVWQRILTLPLYPHLTEEQQDRVIACIGTFMAARQVVPEVVRGAAGVW
jgi:perosamine synthetase